MLVAAGRGATAAVALPLLGTAARAPHAQGLAAPDGTTTPPAAPPPAPRTTAARPAEGDLLVFARGERANRPVAADDLAPDAPQTTAWAMEPGPGGAVRSASRLNGVVLVRLGGDGEGVDEATRARSAGGVVAYSSTCTHAQCPVSEWRRDRGVLHCPCHGSEFDPRGGGRVVGGPATRALPALPLRLSPEGLLVVAAPFVGRVGAGQA